MKIFRLYLSQNNFQKLLKSAFGDSPIMAIYLNKKKVYTKLQDEKHVLYNYVYFSTEL